MRNPSAPGELHPAHARERRVASWLAAFIVPSVICAVTVSVLDPYLDTGGESALFFVGVLLVGLLGGVAPAALSAVLSGLLLNYYLIAPRHSFTIAEPNSAITELVLLLVAVAVAVLVDGATKRTREARLASQEAELLTLFAGSVLRGADLETLLERVRETYSQLAVSILREPSGEDRASGKHKGYVVASVGKDPCVTVDSADTAIEVGDQDFSEFWMLMAGKKLSARDRRVLTAVAKQAAGLIRQRELAEEASRTHAIVQADELRRSLLSAVSHDLRTPLAAAKVAVSSLRAEDVDFSPEDTAELLATIEESIDQLTALVGNLLDSSRLAAGVVRPELHRVYLEETMQRALVSIGKGATGFYRSAIDRVKVDVGDAVVMADSGLLERVFANLIDNALRYAPNCRGPGQRGTGGRSRPDQCHRRRPRNSARNRGTALRSLSAAGRSRQHHRCGPGNVGGARLRRGHGRHHCGRRHTWGRTYRGSGSGRAATGR